MKNYPLIIFMVFVITSSIYLIGKFFDIQPEHYVPYIFWTIAIFIFYMILDSNMDNMFMKNI